MIFVTVGTHEQPFNRLMKKIEQLIKENKITDNVVIQTGYSTYIPKNCECYDMLSWDQMHFYYQTADIVITHGGPASFVDSIALGKKTIVVPRQKKFGEHVNDHQLLFCNELVNRKFPIVVVDDIENLDVAINELKKSNNINFKSNKSKFADIIDNTIVELFK